MSEPIRTAKLRAQAEAQRMYLNDWPVTAGLALLDVAEAAYGLTLLRGPSSIQPTDLAYLRSTLARLDFNQENP